MKTIRKKLVRAAEKCAMKTQLKSKIEKNKQQGDTPRDGNRRHNSQGHRKEEASHIW